MNPYLDGKARVIELGSGPGFAKEYIENKNLILTDIESHSWLDETVDALSLPYAPESVDAFICVHMIHHLATPITFLKEIHKRLRPGGVLLIHEIHPSLLLRSVLRISGIEGWSYNINVFDPTLPACNPHEPWQGNSVIPLQLFANPEKLAAHVPGLEMIQNELCEGFLFPLSGGVTGRVKVVNLPNGILRLVERLDKELIRFFPDIFAFGRRVALRRNA